MCIISKPKRNIGKLREGVLDEMSPSDMERSVFEIFIYCSHDVSCVEPTFSYSVICRIFEIELIKSLENT